MRVHKEQISPFKVSRLNDPVVPLAPAARENILSKNIKNHTFYFSDKWTKGMSQEREGFAELFDETMEGLRSGNVSIASPYNKEMMRF